MARKDLTNQVFGTLKAIEFDEERYKRDRLNPDIKRIKTFWKCECLKWGRIVSVQTSNLTCGNSKGCGCDKFEKVGLSNKKENKIRIVNDRVYILLDNTGHEAIIDLEDWEFIRKYCWYEGNNIYPMTRDHRINKQVMLHRLVIFKTIENSIENRNIILDHIDRNRLNCSKSNLRMCSTSDNAKNISIPSNNTSGIIGVSWSKQWNKWRAFVCIEGKYISLGYYKDKNDAIIARLKGEKEYYKEFAPQKHLFDLYLN